MNERDLDHQKWQHSDSRIQRRVVSSLHTVKNISSLVNIRSKKNKFIPVADYEEDLMILQHIPSNFIKVLDTDSLMLIKTAAKGIVQKTDESNVNAEDAEWFQMMN